MPIEKIQNGIFVGETPNFPLYITDQNITKAEMKKEMGDELLLIYQGKILDALKTKEENLKSLALIKHNQYDLVNLNLEDLLIAKTQKIDLDQTGLNFINTTIEDVKDDGTYRTKRVVPYAIYHDVAVLGLTSPHLSAESASHDLINEYIVNDYTLSILKARKEISLLKVVKNKKIKTFIIIHSLGDEINDVTNRLPPYFMNY